MLRNATSLVEWISTAPNTFTRLAGIRIDETRVSVVPSGFFVGLHVWYSSVSAARSACIVFCLSKQPEIVFANVHWCCWIRTFTYKGRRIDAYGCLYGGSALVLRRPVISLVRLFLGKTDVTHSRHTAWRGYGRDQRLVVSNHSIAHVHVA